MPHIPPAVDSGLRHARRMIGAGAHYRRRLRPPTATTKRPPSRWSRSVCGT